MNEWFQSKVDKQVALRFGTSEIDIKAFREYKKVHGEFHPLSDMYNNLEIVRKWYEESSEKIKNRY